MEKVRTEINKVTYACQMLPGWDGCGLFFDLVAQIGEPAMLMLTRAMADKDLENMDVGEVVGAGAYTFFSRLRREEGVAIMKQIFVKVWKISDDGKTSICLGEDAEFNLHFAGNTMDALKVFVWALQVNYQSFLDGSRLLGAFQAARSVMAPSPKKEETEYTDPPTSPPSSGSSASTVTEATI